MSAIILSEVTAFIAALLFAVHPIHTEAVSKKLLINLQFFAKCASHSTRCIPEYFYTLLIRVIVLIFMQTAKR